MNEWGLADSPSYGAGQNYQATCPSFPPPPTGYAAWSTTVNGAVPPNVVARATALANDMTKPLGYTETIYSGGVPLLLRVDPHTWTTGASGQAVAGCFHGVDVWVPTPGADPSTTTPAGVDPSHSALWVVSLGLGVVVSALTIHEYLKKRRG